MFGLSPSIAKLFYYTFYWNILFMINMPSINITHFAILVIVTIQGKYIDLQLYQLKRSFEAAMQSSLYIR